MRRSQTYISKEYVLHPTCSGNGTLGGSAYMSSSALPSYFLSMPFMSARRMTTTEPLGSGNGAPQRPFPRIGRLIHQDMYSTCTPTDDLLNQSLCYVVCPTVL